jgi:hypothetical protein
VPCGCAKRREYLLSIGEKAMNIMQRKQFAYDMNTKRKATELLKKRLAAKKAEVKEAAKVSVKTNVQQRTPSRQVF